MTTAKDSPAGLDEHQLRRLLEGDGTVASAVLRTLLYIPGKLYGLVMLVRRTAYTMGVFSSYPSGLPTVSVGNITAGGSGKTPTVVFLARWLLEKGHRPAILLRGYAKTEEGESDEAELYRSLVPQAIVAVNPDRRAGAAAAVQEGATILLMDDGFQHRRLKRDLDIVLIDATSPWGGGNTLPGGLLREPICVLKAADAVLVTRSDQAAPEQLEKINTQIARLAPGVFTARARHAPARLYTLDGQALPLDSLKGRKVVVLSGIARPEAFANTLRQAGAEPVGMFAKPDHHPLDRAFVLQAARAAKEKGAWAVTTEKDFAKPLFHHLREEMADNTNTDSKELLTGIRILGVEQKITGVEELLERILQLAPVTR